jgi:hypothetical protein
MNARQKDYELRSRLYNNNNQKVSDYFRFIDQVRARSNQYTTGAERSSIRRFIYAPYKDPDVIRDNKRFKLKIYKIIEEPVLPRLNLEYLEVREILRNARERQKEMAQRALSLENDYYKERLFGNNRSKVEVRRLKNSKTKQFESDFLEFMGKNYGVVLPPIHRSSKNSIKRKEKSEKIFQTEINSNLNDSDNLDNDQSLNSGQMKDHKAKEITHAKRGYYG